MKNLVVQQDFAGGWNVHEVGAEPTLLFRSDRLRAEGYARRLCSPEGGSVKVVSNDGTVLSTYSAKGAGRSLVPGGRRGERANRRLAGPR